MSNKRSNKKEAGSEKSWRTKEQKKNNTTVDEAIAEKEPVSSEVIDYEPESTQHTSACKCDICTGKLKAEKPSKKLVALYIRLDNQLASADKYLEREGLGQNARAKVFKIFEAIADTKLELKKENEK